ncbi:hypothetical protein [Streptomyces sp. LN785]|uniref:hypothetical protein n=1 Tax=Streptomyces sp. LN785 TaxID=3112983 RepID=UPI00371A57DA
MHVPRFAAAVCVAAVVVLGGGGAAQAAAPDAVGVAHSVQAKDGRHGDDGRWGHDRDDHGRWGHHRHHGRWGHHRGHGRWGHEYRDRGRFGYDQDRYYRSR